MQKKETQNPVLPDLIILPDPPKKKKDWQCDPATPEGEHYCKTGIDTR